MKLERAENLAFDSGVRFGLSSSDRKLMANAKNALGAAKIAILEILSELENSRSPKATREMGYLEKFVERDIKDVWSHVVNAMNAYSEE